MREDVPLVVPEINPDDAKKHNGIISNPNCSTIISHGGRLRPRGALRPITRHGRVHLSGGFRRGRGRALTSCEAQVRAYARARAAKNASLLPRTRSPYNLHPADRRAPWTNGYTTEEMKMQNEGRKILHLPDMTRDLHLRARAGAALALHQPDACATQDARSPSREAREAIAAAPGLPLMRRSVASGIYPMPARHAAIRTPVFVGRIRRQI